LLKLSDFYGFAKATSLTPVLFLLNVIAIHDIAEDSEMTFVSRIDHSICKYMFCQGFYIDTAKRPKQPDMNADIFGCIESLYPFQILLSLD